jgi:methyl-accepting chemotaxis protein
MDEVTQQNAALVEEAAAAAESLQDQAGNLLQVVSIFRTGGDQAAPAMAAATPRSQEKAALAQRVRKTLPARVAASRAVATAASRPGVAASPGRPGVAATNGGDWEEF